MSRPSSVPPVRYRGQQHFNIALGGESGVGKSNIFGHLRDTPLPGRGEYQQLSSQENPTNIDCCKFSFITDSAEVGVTLWDTGGLEKFRSMTRSYFHHLSALILVHSTEKESSLERLGSWIDQAVDETSPPVLCVWTNAVDPSDPEDQRVAERVPHFISHRNIDARLCFSVCALSGQVESEGQVTVVDAFNALLERLITKCLDGSTSYDVNSGTLEPAVNISMATRTAEAVRSESNVIQLAIGNEDDGGATRQERRRCWKC